MRSQPQRTRFEGLRKILQFNWPFYFVGGLCLAIGFSILLLFRAWLPLPLFYLGLVGMATAAWWLVASLAASHWIYDRSGIYDFDWLEISPPQRAAILTAGFDESASGLKKKWPDTEWTLLDFYEEETMSEPSIRRARKLYPPDENWKRIPAFDWPASEQSFDLIVFAFSGHEFRSSAERTKLLSEAKRTLAAEGQILIIEHLRDLPNAIVFGPGVFHFHSEKTWLRDFQHAELTLKQSKRLTAFVKAFFL